MSNLCQCQKKNSWRLFRWQGHHKFSPNNLENTWFKTTWYTGLPVRHSLQNTIVVCTNERACSLNSVIAALSNMCCHWSNLKQFGLAFNNVLRRELVVSLLSVLWASMGTKLLKAPSYVLCVHQTLAELYPTAWGSSKPYNGTGKNYCSIAMD